MSHILSHDIDTLDVDCFEALATFDESHRASVLAEMVRLFTDDARLWLAEAERAIVGGDATVLRRVGHSLKSACGTIGAGRMRALAIALEDAATGASATEAGVIVQALVDECGAVAERLRPYLLGENTSWN
jgi:HPt (histidine-containing phosphotransfer) domain-containing protein